MRSMLRVTVIVCPEAGWVPLTVIRTMLPNGVDNEARWSDGAVEALSRVIVALEVANTKSVSGSSFVNDTA